jgi:hypothetical protein
VSRRAELWLQRSRVWGPAAAFLLLNLVLLFAYRLVVTVRVGAQEDALVAAEQQLAEAQERRRELVSAVAAARRTDEEIEHMRGERFGTQAERLTLTMLRVKELARQAGLRGMESIAYGDEPLEDVGLVEKSITFNVSGSYQQLREFINLLELSDLFLALEEIRVSDEADGRLRVSLRLSTLYVDVRGPRA